MRARHLLPALLLALLPAAAPTAETPTVAVASNFAKTAAALAQAFTAESSIPVRLSNGSTGKLYAQIINGAPYDVFLAADAERPQLLEASGHGVRGSRVTYAIGGLVLWSRDKRMDGRNCLELLVRGEYAHLALANPETAPYGAAAREALQAMGLWADASRRAVFGENIAQTLHFVATGNATLGFIAQSQLGSPGLPDATCSWTVPASLHHPIAQQLVLLTRAQGKAAARRFVDFMSGPAAREIIAQHGYRTTQQ